MDSRDRSTLICLIDERGDLESAVQELHEAGFRNDQLGIALRRDEPADGPISEEASNRPGEGAAAGAVTGGALGGVLGALAAGLIPGIGPVLAGGVLAGVVGGATAGSAAGGLLGALVGLGIPEDEAQQYAEEFESGRAILSVSTQDRYDEAVEILRKYGRLRSGRSAQLSASSDVV
jgi:hypothetical protein